MKIPVADEGLYILDTGAWRTFFPMIDRGKCNDCGLCLLYCPVNAIKKNGKEITVDLSYCKGCGICREECPKNAITWEEEVR